MANLTRRSAVALLLSPAAHALAQMQLGAVDELKGYWLVTLQGANARQRLLAIDRIEPEGPDAWQLTLRQSYVENPPKVVLAGRLQRTPDGLRLEYSTGSEARVAAVHNPSGVFEGTFTFPNGKQVPTTLSPLTDDEYAELKQEQAERRRGDAARQWGVRPDSRVELIYLESSNYSCPYCRAWEKEYVSTGKLKDSVEGRGLVVTRVANRRYIPDMFLPANLRPHREALEARARNLFRATPAFIVMVDDRPVSWGVGLGGWDHRVHPALKRIAAARGQR